MFISLTEKNEAQSLTREFHIWNSNLCNDSLNLIQLTISKIKKKNNNIRIYKSQSYLGTATTKVSKYSESRMKYSFLANSATLRTAKFPLLINKYKLMKENNEKEMIT